MTTARRHAADGILVSLETETPALDQLSRGQLDCVPAVAVLHESALAPPQRLAVTVLGPVHRHKSAERQKLFGSRSLAGRAVAVPVCMCAGRGGTMEVQMEVGLMHEGKNPSTQRMHEIDG